MNRSVIYKGSVTRSRGDMSVDHPAKDRLSNTPPQNKQNEEEGITGMGEEESNPKQNGDRRKQDWTKA